MIFVSIAISIIYSILILAFVKGFRSLKVFTYENESEKSGFSIVIPFRNEAENLPYLLSSISEINYPKNQFEIILVNDVSHDDSVKLIEKFRDQNTALNIKIIDKEIKSNSPKKDAIETAIKKSNFEWIITTDADCILPENWLRTMNHLIQKEKPKMIVAPVTYKIENTFLSKFQILDFLSLQGATMAGFGIQKPFLCNGANLCYEKASFKEIKGFSGNNNIASGDDIFMLEKMAVKYPDQVKYLKSTDAIVLTRAQQHISGLLQQRIRWASKTSSYKNPFGKLVGMIIFLMNLYIVVLVFLAFFNHISWHHIGLVFILKFNLDFLLLYPSALFFKQEKSLSSYVSSSILYPFFCVTVVILSFFKKYKWKGRTYSE